MQIIKYQDSDEIEYAAAARVAALGFFDGVHAGHRQLLKTTLAEAKERGFAPTVVTFYSENENIKPSAKRIYTTETKLRIFASLGFEQVILLDFDGVSHLAPSEFVELLFEKLNVRVAVAGYNFRFGKGASGDKDTLVALMRDRGAEAVIVKEEKYKGKPLSASEVRLALSEGRVEDAWGMLGTPFFVESVVVEGNGKGRKIGFPTVNANFQKGLCQLRRGVYRSATEIDGKLYQSVTNVGICPTFPERELHIETFIIDYDGTLYGKKICTYFLGYLREEKRFDSEQELIMQIKVDKNRAIEENGDLKWLEIGQN